MMFKPNLSSTSGYVANSNSSMSTGMKSFRSKESELNLKMKDGMTRRLSKYNIKPIAPGTKSPQSIFKMNSSGKKSTMISKGDGEEGGGSG